MVSDGQGVKGHPSLAPCSCVPVVYRNRNTLRGIPRYRKTLWLYYTANISQQEVAVRLRVVAGRLLLLLESGDLIEYGDLEETTSPGCRYSGPTIVYEVGTEMPEEMAAAIQEAPERRS